MAIRVSAELSHICPLQQIAEHAEALEAQGFHRVWVPDTVVSPWEAWSATCIVSQKTSTIGLGFGVTNPYTRHPVVLAQMAATMQHMSAGRLAISLGKGIGPFLDRAGVRQHPKAVEECVTVLRPLMAGERTHFQGEAFTMQGVKTRVPPPRTPVPLYVAAIGPSGWDCAVRTADGVATMWSDTLVQTRTQHTGQRSLPVAVLIPFARSRSDFFPNRVASLEELRQKVSMLEQDGFDEVIVAYADMGDLEAASLLVAERGAGR